MCSCWLQQIYCFVYGFAMQKAIFSALSYYRCEEIVCAFSHTMPFVCFSIVIFAVHVVAVFIFSLLFSRRHFFLFYLLEIRRSLCVCIFSSFDLIMAYFICSSFIMC